MFIDIPNFFNDLSSNHLSTNILHIQKKQRKLEKTRELVSEISLPQLK